MYIVAPQRQLLRQVLVRDSSQSPEIPSNKSNFCQTIPANQGYS